jgi:hypothetical protein
LEQFEVEAGVEAEVVVAERQQAQRAVQAWVAEEYPATKDLEWPRSEV